MLACARIGAIHSVVFGGFAAAELATRINDAKPRAILTASCGIEPTRTIAYKPLVDQAIDIAAHKPEACVVLQRPQVTAELKPGRDHDWQALVECREGAGPQGRLRDASRRPIRSIFSTLPAPPASPRASCATMAGTWWRSNGRWVPIYDIKPGEVYWAASDVGWVVGHSYIVYAPLLHGATTIVFEGKPVGTPDAGTFWRVISEYGVSALFTAPTAFRAIKKEDPDGRIHRQIRSVEIPHTVPGRRARRS